ncbi:MAG TPA: polyprenyl synthetase family protein [Myxococcota bacterium]|jgi:geranylgeranyl pyrophosphate synthase|nr:polyprenyl synthetase family protein [Myxococcota bacterium]
MSPDAAPRFLDGVRADVEALLARELAGEGRLAAAMRYAVLGAAPGGGGKRLRPAVCLAVAEAVAGVEGRRLALPAAAAVELVHAYSLVHDDLPGMDDDPVRRGAPATHAAHGPGTATRAGLALACAAFGVVAAERPRGPPPAARLALVRSLAAEIGARGLVGGQWLDLGAEGHALDAAALESIHAAKTGALFRAAAHLGALAAGADAARCAASVRYGHALGVGFQIVDDLLDAAGSAALRKRAHADAQRAKSTAPAVLGASGARARLADLRAEALAAAAALDPTAGPLAALAAAALDPARR